MPKHDEQRDVSSENAEQEELYSEIVPTEEAVNVHASEDDEAYEETKIDDSFIMKICGDMRILLPISKYFKMMPIKRTSILVENLLKNRYPINISHFYGDKWKKFHKFNMSRFDKDKNLEKESVVFLKTQLNELLTRYYKETITIKIIDEEGENIKFKLNKNVQYSEVRRLICDELGHIHFNYDFENPDMKISHLTSSPIIQRAIIQIFSPGIAFDYPIQYHYYCPICETERDIPAYDVESTHNKISCIGRKVYTTSDGEMKTKVCGTWLNPMKSSSKMMNAFYYGLNHTTEEGGRRTASAFSFLNLKPGYYDAIIFRVFNDTGRETYHIISVKKTKANVFIPPAKVEGENYLFTLQKEFDRFIAEKTGVHIWGLNPVKIALLIQKMFSILEFPLISNVQVIGDASTGKTMTLRYYGFLLNGYYHLMTNGLSISVPALRGTKNSVNYMGREYHIVSPGYLGMYFSIHIDEAGENIELVRNLKTFLYETNYGYNRAGSDDIVQKRLAHVNLSENISNEHIGAYRGYIRKAYREMTIKIANTEKIEWNEEWDLHQPMFRYTNPYLYKVIRDKRIELELKRQFWIDGYDAALHERFPFYFYLVNEKENADLAKTVRKNNFSMMTAMDNIDLITAIYSEDIEVFLRSFVKHKESSTEEEQAKEIDAVLKEYNMRADSRTKTFFYNLVRISRIVNQRSNIEKMDINLMRWFIEKTNCKVDVADTNNYDVMGISDPNNIKQIEKVVEEARSEDDQFALPSGEF